MNNEERNILTVVTIARIVENTLWFCLPPKEQSSFSGEEIETRHKALLNLTSENSPFYLNAKNNGEKGDELIDKMNYFIEDCYSGKGRIISLDLHKNVNVEESLIVELYVSIVQLRVYLDSFLMSGLEFLKNNNMLEDDFKTLVLDDIRYYHAFAAKVGSMLLVKKFKELNEYARSYMRLYSQSHNGVDPTKDPNFNVKNDPSFRMVESEFHDLNDAFVLGLNSYNEDDPEFKVARENVYQDSEIFTGKKKTTDMDKYFEIYIRYFDSIIQKTQNKLSDEFKAISEAVVEFESANFKDEEDENEDSESTSEDKKEEVNSDESK